MTDLDVLERLQATFGGNIYETVRQQDHHRPAWRWQLGARGEVIACIEAVLPFLCARRSAQATRTLAHARALDQESQDRRQRFRARRDHIRVLRGDGLKQREIAERLGVDRSYVGHVLTGRYGDD